MVAIAVKLLRAGSIVICLIVIGSFTVFAVDQTKSASAAQQAELSAGASPPAAASNGAKPPAKHENGVHEALDEASMRLTSPFAGIVDSADGEWATRGVRLLLALLVYGFGLGYLARALRVRV